MGSPIGTGGNKLAYASHRTPLTKQILTLDFFIFVLIGRMSK
jgi:hypothetical protein